MKIDRDLQLELLNNAKAVYPDGYRVKDQTGDEGKNLHYLHEHGLIRANYAKDYPGKPVVTAAITAQGLDFLEDDGGLGAILGVVTVRLHADTVRDLIALRIDQSDIPEVDKSRFKKHLKDLPGSALAHLTNRLLDLALQNSPAAMDLIQRVIFHMP